MNGEINERICNRFVMSSKGKSMKCEVVAGSNITPYGGLAT